MLLTIVGLPARGKSWTAKKINAYFSWLGFKSRIFSFEDNRIPTPARRRLSSQDLSEGEIQNPPNHQNEPEEIVNEEIKEHTNLIDNILGFFKIGGEIAIYIPWSTTHKKRVTLMSRVKSADPSIDVLFLENICNEAATLNLNIKNKIDTSTHLKDMPKSEGVKYVQQRVKSYQRGFETISDDSLSYIKIINMKSKMISNRVYGNLSTRVMSLVQSMHLELRPLWLVRTEDEADQERHQKFRLTLRKFIEKRIPTRTNELVIFSSMEATKTIEFMNIGTTVVSSVLSPLNTGTVPTYTTPNFSLRYPDVYNKFNANPINYRFPKGESFKDLIHRLEPYILQLERYTVPVMVVAHDSVIKALYSYFLKQRGLSLNPCSPNLLPSYTIVELASTHTGWTDKIFNLLN
uniref:6-phosphofructo-2-kinase domain-containing protein n=1 Tax=Arcella intermedia TaxID=1963864 RepID=A0A6B2L5U3_9EUKA